MCGQGCPLTVQLTGPLLATGGIYWQAIYARASRCVLFYLSLGQTKSGSQRLGRSVTVICATITKSVGF